MRTVFLSFTINNSSVTDFLLALSNELAKNHRVVVITDAQEPHPFHIDPKIEIHKWPSRRPTKIKDLRFLISLIKKYQPHAMIALFGSVNMFLIGGFLMGVKHRISWCRTLSTQFDWSGFKNFRKKMLYKLGTHFFANSQATRDDVCANFGVPKQKIVVFPNAVREPLGEIVSASGKNLLYVGRLHATKGIDVLIDALPAVQKQVPDFSLKVIGGGVHLQQYRDRVVQMGLSDNVEFLGQRLKPEVLDAFRNCSFTIVPSLQEAFGFVVIESFSFGKPVIGSDTTGISEIVRHEKDGLLFEPGNPTALSDAILKLLDNPVLLKEMGENCMKHFRSNYEVENVARIIGAHVSNLP